MDLQLTGKLAFLSGSTKGIGLAIATALAAEGARVIVNGRTEPAVQEARAHIRETCPGATVEAFAGDLGSAEGAETLVKQFPAVDILVNERRGVASRWRGGAVVFLSGGQSARP